MAHPILAAQDALKALLTARPAYTGVDVRDGAPTEGEDVTANAFWFDDVDISDGWASIGAQRRRTTITLKFTIACITYGDDEHSTRDAALLLLKDLQDTIKANPALGIPAVIQQADDVNGNFNSQPVATQQWGAMFRGSLACTSRAY